MSKIKNGGLDQYGAESFEQQQFETAGVEGVNSQQARGSSWSCNVTMKDGGVQLAVMHLICILHSVRTEDVRSTKTDDNKNLGNSHKVREGSTVSTSSLVYGGKDFRNKYFYIWNERVIGWLTVKMVRAGVIWEGKYKKFAKCSFSAAFLV